MERVNDVFEQSSGIKRALKAASPPTPSQQKLIEAASAIRLDPDAVERAYMARQLVQCTLPHRNPGNVPVWGRKNGNTTLTLQQGYDGVDKPLGYPYGTIPRLLLFWITTEAVLTKKSRLELGSSLGKFMRAVGLDPNTGGGKRSDARRLREQMGRLFSCRISFNEQLTNASDTFEGKRWVNMQITEKGEYWWSPAHPEQGALWGSWIELGQTFFEMITAAPVPVDLRALRVLKGSPLALDLYAWMTHRVFSINRANKFQFIPWDGLMKQIGTEYRDIDEFARNTKKALRKVETVWRDKLNIKLQKGGFMLYPSPLPISEKLSIKAK